MKPLQNIYKRLLLLPGAQLLFKPFRRDCATIFMLHRFCDRRRGITGLEPSVLRNSLEYLRRNNFELISLSDLFSRLTENVSELNGAVAFTIDDGYIDHAKIAGPVFAEFECPVTTFITTGFLDGNLWMWWDKIEYIFTKTNRTSLNMQINGKVLHYNFTGNMKRSSMIYDFVQLCKTLEESEKRLAIDQLSATADVELPDSPPEMYSPMSWDDARACEGKGMTFGPHTVTHPILSKVPIEQSVSEITLSWQRLSEELQYPTPVFCYPNGQLSDFGSREIEVFRNLGLLGAVIGEAGYADIASFKKDEKGPFKVSRFSYPESSADFIQCVSGIERFKQMVRNRL